MSQGKDGKARGLLSRFRRERRGAAAIEFVFIAPLMLALYFLTMEFAQAIETSRKLSRVANLVGDLVTQSPVMSRNELDAIMKIGEAVLQPYNRTRAEIVVTAIRITDDQTPRAEVVWSRRVVDGAFGRDAQPGTQTTVPEAMNKPGTFLIRSEARLPYAPVITWSPSGKQTLGLLAAFDRIDMGDRYYLRPRLGLTIPCPDC